MQRLLATQDIIKKADNPEQGVGDPHTPLLSLPAPEVSSSPSAKDTNLFLHTLQALLRKLHAVAKHGQMQDWASLHPSAPPQARQSFPQTSLSPPVPPKLTRCFLVWAG